MRLPALLLISLWQLAAQPAPEVIVERGHGREVTAVALSPDNRYALSSDKSGSVILWDVSSGRELHRVEDCKCDMGNLAFSLDGKLALAAIWAYTGGYYVQGWSLPDLRPVRTWKRKDNEPQTVAVSPLTGNLVTAGYDRPKKGWTLTFWDYASGREIRTVPSSDQSDRIFFTPDGKYVAVTGPRSAGIFDANTGRYAKLSDTAYAWLPESYLRVEDVAFSGDGKVFFSKSYERTEFLEAANPTPRAFKPAGDCEINSSTLSKVGRDLLVGCSNGGMRLYDLSSGALLRSFAGLTVEIRDLTLSRDGTRVFTGPNWWDLTTGRMGGTLPITQKPIASTISPDGHLGVTYTYAAPVLWDLDRGVSIGSFPLKDPCFGAKFTLDGKNVLLSLGEKGAILWNLRDGGRIFPSIRAEYRPAISPTQNYAMNPSAAGDSQLVSLDTGEVVRTLPRKAPTKFVDRFPRAAFSADGNTAIVGTRALIEVWDVPTGRLLQEMKDPYGMAEGISPDGKTIVTYQFDIGYKIFSTATGKELRSFPGPLAFSIEFTPDGRRFLTSGEDRVVHLWDLATAREILRMVAFTNGEWVAITPEGYYSASAKGDQYLTVRMGASVFGIDQFRKTFYRPQVVEAILRTGDAGKAISSVLGGQSAPMTLASPELAAPPTIEVQQPAAGTSELAVQVNDLKQPIESISVSVNGRQVTGGARKLDIPAGQKQLDLKIPVQFDPGENDVEITASNGGAETRRGIIVNRPTQTAEAEILPNLWILAIGVNRYQSPALASLNYAEADAVAVAAEFAKQKGKMYRDVHTMLITDSSAIKPTHDNIVDNLNYLKQAGQNDIVLLFVAGHGVDDSAGDFYFLPSDAAFQDDGNLRPSKAVSSLQLKSVLDVPSRKIILLDACHSEGVTGRKTRSAESDFLVRELHETRGVILSSSRGKELSQEGPQWKHGAFTYALLEGMRGAADFLKTGEISMLALATYVTERVPVMTKTAQHPILDTSEGYRQLEIVSLK